MSLKGYKRRETPPGYSRECGDEVFSITIASRGRHQPVATLHKRLCATDPQTNSYEFKLGKSWTSDFPLKLFFPSEIPDRIIKGWHLCQKSGREWQILENDIKSDDKLQWRVARAYEAEYERRYDLSKNNHIWVIRGFMFGTDGKHAPPHIVVLGIYPPVSKIVFAAAESAIKDCKSRDLERKRQAQTRSTQTPYEWGVVSFDFGNFDVLTYGSERGNSEQLFGGPMEISDGLGEEPHKVTLISGRLTVSKPLPSWLEKRHRCGIMIKLMVGGSKLTERIGTLGGVIKVNNRLYGLTVAHFLLPAMKGAGRGTDAEGEDSRRTQSYGTTSDLAATVQPYDMNLDWALIELPGLDSQASSWQKMNLVQTASGDFRPMLVALEEPPPGRLVVLSTPASTYGLRGTFSGSHALVGIAASSVPFSAWVIQMEYPWLIKEGDSGSWAFDASTGDFLGVFVAGCPDLLEAYIIPGFKVFDDIQAQFRGPVSLGNDCIGLDAQKKVQDITKYYRDLKQRINLGKGHRYWREIDNEIDEWTYSDINKKIDEWTHRNIDIARLLTARLFTTTLETPLEAYHENFIDWVDPNYLARARYEWLSALEKHSPFFSKNLRDLSDLEDSDLEASDLENVSTLLTEHRHTSLKLTKAAIRQSPIQCYNSMNKLWRKHSRQRRWLDLGPVRQRELVIINTIWDHLIIGKDDVSSHKGHAPSYNDSEKLILHSTNQNYISSMSQDQRRRVTHNIFAWGEEYPRDRVSLSQYVFSLGWSLKMDLESTRSRFRGAFPGVNPSVRFLDEYTELGNPFLLFGALVMNERMDQVLNIIVLSRSDHDGNKTEVINESSWNHLPEEYRSGPNSIRYSSVHLPIAHWNKLNGEDTNLGQLLQEKLGFEGPVTWKRKSRLIWDRDESLSNYPLNFHIRFYEVIISDSEWPVHKTNESGWSVIPRDLKSVEYILPPQVRNSFKAHYNLQGKAAATYLLDGLSFVLGGILSIT